MLAGRIPAPEFVCANQTSRDFTVNLVQQDTLDPTAKLVSALVRACLMGAVTVRTDSALVAVALKVFRVISVLQVSSTILSASCVVAV